MESVPTGTFDAASLDVQHNGGDVGIAAQDCPLDDGASLALWEAFRSGALIPATAIDNPTSPLRTSKPDGSSPPLYTPELALGSPGVDKGLGDKSPFEERELVQSPKLIDGRARNTATPSVSESSPVGHEDTSRAALDISADAGPLKGSTSDRAPYSRSANTTDVADDAVDAEGSDGDESPVTRRR